MEMSDTHKQLIAKLAEELGPATAQHLVSCLVEAAAKPNQVEGVLVLLDELTRSRRRSLAPQSNRFPICNSGVGSAMRWPGWIWGLR